MLEPLLPRLKREIEARLAELRPMVAEAQRLIAVKEAMLAEAAAEQGRRRPSTRVLPPRSETASQQLNGTGAKPASANGRAPRGANQEAILAIVEERPGVSVAEIASVTKIAKPTVAATVSKLKREGVLADEAGGVKLASRQPLTLAQIAARDEGVSDEEWEAAAARRGPAAA